MNVHHVCCVSACIEFDPFIQWLETEFLGYLDRWGKSVCERPGISRVEQKLTRHGLRTTGIFSMVYMQPVITFQ